MVTQALVRRQTLDASNHEFSKSSNNDLHLQFVNPPDDGGFGDKEIDMFLKKIFRGSSPLAYLHHQQSQSNGKTVVQVQFKLSDSGRLRNISFEDAGRNLCGLIFDKKSRKLLSFVTSESILGVSAVSAIWSDWFNRAFFAAGVSQGPPLLREIVTSFTNNYLPLWALVLAFSVVTNFNIGAFLTTGTLNTEGMGQLFGVLGVRYSRQILEAFATHRSVRPPDEIERDWKVHHNQYKACMDRSIELFSQCTEGTTASADDGAMSPSAQLCDALYTMAENAALVLTSNQELLKAFIQACDTAKREGLLAQAGAGLSFATVAGAMVTGALGVIAEDVALIAASEACVVPGVALVAGVVGGIYCVVKVKQKIKKAKQFNKRIVYHEEMRDFIIQSWRLAADTEQFLKWVHCTGMTTSVPINWVDQETRANWQQFLDTIHQAGGGSSVTLDTVKTYLNLREVTLKGIRESVEKADQEAFGSQ